MSTEIEFTSKTACDFAEWLSDEGWKLHRSDEDAVWSREKDGVLQIRTTRELYREYQN